MNKDIKKILLDKLRVTLINKEVSGGVWYTAEEALIKDLLIEVCDMNFNDINEFITYFQGGDKLMHPESLEAQSEEFKELYNLYLKEK